MPRALQASKEKTLAAKHCGFDISHILDVIVYALRESYQTSGIHSQGFSGSEFPFNNGSARMDEAIPLPIQLLHDETFSPKEGYADLSLKGHANRNPFGCTEKGIFLADESITVMT